MTVASWTYADYDNEKGTFSIGCIPLAADGSNYAAWKTARDAVTAALVDLTIGNMQQTALHEIVRTSNAAATHPAAARERKWVLTLEDVSTLGLYTVELPVADHLDSLLRFTNQDVADLSDSQWTAFTTAFESFYRTKAGNQASLLSAVMVGRNI